MKDEEFIEIEIKRTIYNSEKPIYKFGLKDFIPYVGLKKYRKEEKKEYAYLNESKNILPVNIKENSLDKSIFKEMVLGWYNSAILGVAAAEIYNG